MPLKEFEVRKANPRDKPYKLSDGEGLHLLVNPNGSKLWQQRYRFLDKEKMLSHGKYPTVGISDARRKCREAKQLLADGVDPSVQKKLDKISSENSARTTFLLVAEEYLEVLSDRELADQTMKKKGKNRSDRGSRTGPRPGKGSGTGESARPATRHAKDYVRMQWMMLQQDTPEDYVIATGVQYSVRQFMEWSAAELGITLSFSGSGLDEVATVSSLTGDSAPGLNVGDVVMRIDPRYFRPAEVETLLGDPSKAKAKLGWVPEITVQEMCSEMVTEDLKASRRYALLKKHDMDVPVSIEG